MYIELYFYIYNKVMAKGGGELSKYNKEPLYPNLGVGLRHMEYSKDI